VGVLMMGPLCSSATGVSERFTWRVSILLSRAYHREILFVPFAFHHPFSHLRPPHPLRIHLANGNVFQVLHHSMPWYMPPLLLVERNKPFRYQMS